ncbi:MAG: hypothetical protein K0T99_02260 [Alphaproteobacteria bacterium]|nr:hypothetical protein [Alphaproteobacteria bacterium]
MIEDLHYYSKSNIPYKNSIIYSNNNRFTNAIIKQGLESIIAHKKNTELNFFTQQKTYYYGVANEIFAKAENGLEFLKHIRDVTGIEIKIINKQEELKIRYDSVIAALGIDKKRKLLVWESGKEEMYFINKENDKFKTELVQPSYETFNEKLKKHLKREIILNPMSKDEIKKSIELAETLIKIPNRVKKLVEESNLLAAIGPIHNYVLQHYVNFHNISKLIDINSNLDLWEYSQSDLEGAMDFLSNKTNKELAELMYNKRSYYNVDKEVSNTILAYAIMKKLNIKSTQTLNPKVTFGLLIQK